MTNYDIVLDAVLGSERDADEFFRVYREFDPDDEYDPTDMALDDALDGFTWAKYEVSDYDDGYDGDDYPKMPSKTLSIRAIIHIGGEDMRRIAIVLLTAVMAFALVACREDIGSALVGSWHCAEGEYTITFTAGGKATVEFANDLSLVYGYSIDGDEVVLTLGNSSARKAFSVKGDTLTLDGDTLTRVK